MSIVDTFYKSTPRELMPPENSREWWLSDAGRDHRCAEYIANALHAKWNSMLSGNSARYLEHVEIKTFTEPEWPAIEWYYIGMDEILWLRCEVPIWLKDYARAYPNRLNKAAREILNQMETSI